MTSLAILLLGIGAPFEAKALLDSPTLVRAVLTPPLSADELSRPFTFMKNAEVVAVVKGSPEGDPVRPRLLPRTPGRVVLAGSFQSELGGSDWDPDGEVTQMEESSPGVFVLSVRLPAGQYEFKAARNGNWGENWGAGFVPNGPNITLRVTQATLVGFRVDFNRKAILTSLTHPDEGPWPKEPTSRPKPEGPDRFAEALIRLPSPVKPEDLDDELVLQGPTGSKHRIYARDILNGPEYVADGAPLGPQTTRKSTVFRTWSPVASRVTVLLDSQGARPRRIPLTRGPKGVWSAEVAGDLHGSYYQMEFESYGRVRRTTDIHCFAASPDSQHSMVVDLDRTDPPRWPSRGPRLARPTDAIVYEIHVRDFTIHASSGVPAAERGRYLGLARHGAKSPGGYPSGLEYLRSLGVTDIHLLPIQNVLTQNPDDYNWGYVTNLFNVPEESYAVQRDKPVEVIREVKQMIGEMHRAGLRVVLDVVYNHTWPPEGEGSPFEQTVPYYWFRTDGQGRLVNESGVGNAMADERPMVRRYVRDSLVYWTKEYGVDGFRFDLLGMHYPESVRDWVAAIRKVRPDATLYGEPWTGGGPTHFGKGAQKGQGIAVFNDRFRGVFRGELDGAGPGFLAGGSVDGQALRRSVAGSLTLPSLGDGFTAAPSETINYVSAHDNMTLRDRLALSLPSPSPAKESSVGLAMAAVLLSQGIPFWEGGAEMGRTKGGSHNSYNQGDPVNQYHWSDGEKFASHKQLFSGLAKIRRSWPHFRLATQAEVERSLRFVSLPGLGDQGLAWTIDLPNQPRILVLLNGSKETRTVALPEGPWRFLAQGPRAQPAPFGSAGKTAKVEALSANVLVSGGSGRGVSESKKP